MVSICVLKTQRTFQRMDFDKAITELTAVQQLISFWTHTIDMYMLQFYEHKTSMISTCLPITTIISKLAEVHTEEAYMGAIRAGLKRSIAFLPEEARISIESYFEDRLNILHNSDVRPDLVKCDVIFGDKDPTNFYYSGVRLHEKVPLTSAEFKTILNL